MKRVFGGVVAIAAAFSLAACGGSSDGGSPLGGGQTPAPTGPPVSTTAATDPSSLTVGSANFPESQLLAEIYAGAIKAKGVDVKKQLNIGSRETYLPALSDGSIDLIPEYSGTLLQYFDKKATQTTDADVYTALQQKVPAPLTVLDKSAAEDKDAVVVTKETATKWNLKTIADLAPHGGEVVFGGPPEFQKRPDGIPGLQKTYGLQIKEYKSLDAGGPLTVNGLKTGAVQAADLFTTDPSIAANNFVVLEDPKSNFAAQSVLPLINSTKAGPKVREALNAVSAKLTTQTLIELNGKLNAPSKPDPASIAAQWLKEQGLDKA
jgi:osmoprotectant transport system substrate-binding protein